MKILVTGAAGFIGSHLAYKLSERGDEVVGIDNLNTYYDPNLKLARLEHFFGIVPDASWPIKTCNPDSANQTVVSYRDMPWSTCISSPRNNNMRFIRLDITDQEALPNLFATEHFDVVVNLAAQAGVRYSITNPMTYVENNVVGFMNVLECCRQYDIKHLVYASSSSIYGLNNKTPFTERDAVRGPVSIYAATKLSNELMAHAYAHLHKLPSTGLRFFTVYGPWGRPDMAPMLFANAISKGQSIKVFNNGDLMRDFTYIDDVVDGAISVVDQIPSVDSDGHKVKIYNIGCSNPIKLMDFIHSLEQALDKEAVKEFLPMQQGDVYKTYADTTLLETEIGYHPHVQLTEGVKRFIQWYNNYKL